MQADLFFSVMSFALLLALMQIPVIATPIKMGSATRTTYLEFDAVSSYGGSIFAARVPSEVIAGPSGACLMMCEKHIINENIESVLF